MNEQPSLPTLRPDWHAAGWFGAALGSVLWIAIYAVVILAETGAVLYGMLCLAAALTVAGFAWYLWTKRESLAYGVALQVVVGMAGLAALAAFALGDLAGGVGYPLATYWWVLLLFPLLGLQLNRTLRNTQPAGPFELVHRFALSELLPSAACAIEGDAIRVTSSGRVEVPLFRLRNVSHRNCILLLNTEIESQALTGKGYLEMDCTIAGKGTFFSKALQDSVVGTQPWRRCQAPFYLRGDQLCEEIQIKLVFEGAGQVRLRNAELFRAPA